MRNRTLLAAPIPALAVLAVGGAGIALERGSLPLIAFVGVAAVATAVVVATALKLRSAIADAIDAFSGDVARLAREVADGGEVGAAMLAPTDEQFNPLVRSINALAAETETATADRVRAELEPVPTDEPEDLRAALAEIVVDLARRSQALLDRQIEFIDRLEHDESDPDRLAELFRIDHLATRMRRNAESLLVLADPEPKKRPGEPVDIAEVMRVAVGEIENYQHIEFENIEGGLIGPATAFDVAHLLAELMENATQFSPPDNSVIVSAAGGGEGRYTITVIDRGIGMPTDRLAEANRTLADPPELSLETSRSLGFAVIGRLAERLGASVSLAETPGGGITASVVFSTRLFIGPAESAVGAASRQAAAAPTAPSAENGSEANGGDPFSMLGGDPPSFETTTEADRRPKPDRAPTQPQVDPMAWPTEATVPTPVSSIGRSSTGSAPNTPAPVDPAPNTPAPVDPAPNTPAPNTPAPPTPPVPQATTPESTKTTAAGARTDAGNLRPAPGIMPDWPPPHVSTLTSPPAWSPPAPPARSASSSEPAERRPNGTPGPGPAPAAEAETRNGDRTTPGAEMLNSGLKRRTKGESRIPIGEGRPVAASSRTPAEIQSMLSRYRAGLKTGKDAAAAGATSAAGRPDPGSAPTTPAGHEAPETKRTTDDPAHDGATR